MEQRLPVWREECQSFKKLQKAFSFLLFWILSRLFPSLFLSVQAPEEESQTSGCVDEENLLFLHVTQWNLPAISRRFTQQLDPQI